MIIEAALCAYLAVGFGLTVLSLLGRALDGELWAVKWGYVPLIPLFWPLFAVNACRMK